MTQKKDNGKRLAIIIGINAYEESQIPLLYGAENDAKELRDVLVSRGNFEILPNHFLLGKDATYKRITRAISEIFRRGIDYSLVIFYFSGHGMLHGEKEGYISPYDMDPKDPIVCGLNMEVLRQIIYQSKEKAGVIVILDCCYAGIAAENTKGDGSDLKAKHLYQLQAQQIVASSSKEDNDKLMGSGRGKIILASSEADAVSRELSDCKHHDHEPGHPHGRFTFHLIEGLVGKAGDPKTGVITIDKLKDYIEKNMDGGNAEEQRLIYNVSGGAELSNIRIAVSEKTYYSNINKIIGEADGYLKGSILPDIQSLEQAAKRAHELEKLDENNTEIKRLVTVIEDAIGKQKDRLIDWLIANDLALRIDINRIRPDLYRDFSNFVDKLSYDYLQTIDDGTLLYLTYLCDEVDRHVRYDKDDKISMQPFIKRINSLHKSLQKFEGAK